MAVDDRVQQLLAAAAAGPEEDEEEPGSGGGVAAARRELHAQLWNCGVALHEQRQEEHALKFLSGAMTYATGEPVPSAFFFF